MSNPNGDPRGLEERLSHDLETFIRSGFMHFNQETPLEIWLPPIADYVAKGLIERYEIEDELRGADEG